MPLLTPDELSRSLAAGDRGGVYFLFGGEEFLKEEMVTELIEAHLDPATRDFNLDQLRAADGGFETLSSILQTPPMMAEWRVVVVREAQALAGSARMRATIEELIESRTPGLVLILTAQIPERSRAQFYEVLKKKARAVEFAPLSGGDLPGWLMQRSEREGIRFEPDAARALVSAVGTEIGVLERELSKLLGYVGDRRQIELADIEAVVGQIDRQNRWEWFDMVGQRRLSKARAAIPTLLDARESGVGLVLGLGTHCIRLAIALSGGERALRDALPPHQRWLAGRLTKQAREWRPHDLAAALDDLLRADRLLKSASLTEEQVLDELLLRMQSRQIAAAA